MAFHLNQHSFAGLHNRSVNCDENLSHIAFGLEDKEKRTLNEKKNDLQLCESVIYVKII